MNFFIRHPLADGNGYGFVFSYKMLTYALWFRFSLDSIYKHELIANFYEHYTNKDFFKNPINKFVLRPYES